MSQPESTPPANAPNPTDKIPIPLTRNLQFWRQKYLPALLWIAALGTALALLTQQSGSTVATGFVEARETLIAPTTAGRIDKISVTLFQTVEAGDPLASIHDPLLAAELLTARQEIERLRAEHKALAAQLEWDQKLQQREEVLNDRRFALDEAQSRMNLLDRIATRESQKVQLQLLRTTFERESQLMERGIMEAGAFDETTFQIQALETTLRESELAMEAARKLTEESSSRLEDIRKRYSERSPVDPLLTPLLEAIKVQESIVSQLSARADSLVLRAPFPATISQILLTEGATAQANLPILLLTERNNPRIVAWVHEKTAHTITPGTTVQLQTLENRPQILTGTVTLISPRIEELPLRFQHHPLFRRWGRQIIVTAPEANKLLPGQRIDVNIGTLK